MKDCGVLRSYSEPCSLARRPEPERWTGACELIAHMAEFRHRRRAGRRLDGDALAMAAKFVTYANGGILSVKAVAENSAAATLKRQRHWSEVQPRDALGESGAQRAELQPAAGLCRC